MKKLSASSQYVVITSSTSTPFVFDQDDQSVTIAPGVLVTGADAEYGIYDNYYSEEFIENFGDISSNVSLKINGSDNSVSNAAGAVLQGTILGMIIAGSNDSVNNGGLIEGGARGLAIANSHNDTVISDGSIIGLNIGADLANVGDVVINNAGKIAGPLYGIELTFGKNTLSSIVNSGLISGNTAALEIGGDGSGTLNVRNSGILDGGAEFGDQITNLRNFGSIDGDLDFGSGDNTVLNTGTITGDMDFFSGRDAVINRGAIKGDIFLGDNGSSFNGRGGSVSGTVTGGGSADTLVAGSDGEVLSGEGGHDTLYGGGGADTFAFNSLAAADTDVVHRFDVAHDTIQLSQDVYTALTAGDRVVFSTGSKATSPADHLFYNSGTGALFYDADGSGTKSKATLVARFDPGLHLTVDNFSVV